jgi:hypothetical protein
MPFGVSALLALAGMIYFTFFYEAVILFLLSDVLYGVREAKFSSIIFIAFFVSIALLTNIEITKKKTRLR